MLSVIVSDALVSLATRSEFLEIVRIENLRVCTSGSSSNQTLSDLIVFILAPNFAHWYTWRLPIEWEESKALQG
jgi:hypothetical protein